MRTDWFDRFVILLLVVVVILVGALVWATYTKPPFPEGIYCNVKAVCITPVATDTER